MDIEGVGEVSSGTSSIIFSSLVEYCDCITVRSGIESFHVPTEDCVRSDFRSSSILNTFSLMYSGPEEVDDVEFWKVGYKTRK